MPEINSADQYDLERANKIETYVVYDRTSSHWVPALSIEIGHEEHLTYQEFADLREALEHSLALFDKMLDQYESG